MRHLLLQGLDSRFNFCQGITESIWENTNIDLGSDHYIITIKLEIAATKLREYKLIDWDKFRKLRTPKAHPQLLLIRRSKAG